MFQSILLQLTKSFFRDSLVDIEKTLVKKGMLIFLIIEMRTRAYAHTSDKWRHDPEFLLTVLLIERVLLTTEDHSYRAICLVDYCRESMAKLAHNFVKNIYINHLQNVFTDVVF